MSEEAKTEDTVANERSFVVSVPRIGFCDVVKASSLGDAAREIRASGEFDRLMTEMMTAVDFESLLGDVVAYVVDVDNHQVASFELRGTWEPIRTPHTVSP